VKRFSIWPFSESNSEIHDSEFVIKSNFVFPSNSLERSLNRNHLFHFHFLGGRCLHGGGIANQFLLFKSEHGHFRRTILGSENRSGENKGESEHLLHLIIFLFDCLGEILLFSPSDSYNIWYF